MDALDFVHPSAEFTATAVYTTQEHDDMNLGGQEFKFAFVNTQSQTYTRLFGNVQAEAGEVAIRTDDYRDYTVGSFVVLPNGNKYQIIQVEKDYSKASRQALRNLARPMGMEYVLRLVEIVNVWG